MIYRLIESFNDSPFAVYLIIVGIAIAFGGIPPILERRRRRSIENALPGFLEAMSDGVGAGLGLQEVMMEQSKIQTGPLGNLLSEALSTSQVTSFDESLSAFATSSRSAQVQRVTQLIQTAVEHNAPLQSILYDLSHDYERLNDLINEREKNLSGIAMTIVLFVCLGLPGVIALIVGQFAPASKGFQLTDFNNTFAIFFGAASLVAVATSARMLGRFRENAWFFPFWFAFSMMFYHAAV
ncbi:MAG: type II secretion system F family protein [Candidatus Poseidoniaceae archaeon]